jgi:glucosamine--fructose-6-phosphate aminotransferase (isomerizing)
MCGIVGFTGTQDAGPLLLDGLKRLEYRGYDSAGIAVQSGGMIRAAKASGHLQNLCEKTHDGADLPGTCGIGHTRWATHGAPTVTNAHPHLSDDGVFAVVHNGIIENYAELREELIGRGFVFHSETDTEVVVHLLDSYYKGDLKAAVMKTVSRLSGSYALGVVCADHPGELIAVKSASPLILGVGVGESFFASDVTALVSHTRNVIYLEDGEFASLTPDRITVFDCTGKEVEKKVSRVVWDVEAAEKGGYEHFMIKEIHEQPRAVRDTLASLLRDGAVDLSATGMEESLFRSIQSIHIVACGSAWHVGMLSQYVIEDLCRIPVRVELASEFRYRRTLLPEGALVIVISQSGETADSLAALRAAKAKGVPVLAIVNVVGSTIAREADYVLYTLAGPEIAVATTKAYSAQLVAMYALAVALGRIHGTIDELQFEAYRKELLALPDKMERTFENKERIQWFASKHANARDVFFIGRGLDYAICLEGSLKMKEISYIHSEAYAAGELKHGTISLVENGTLVIGVLTQNALVEKTVSNMAECKARGAYLMGLTGYGNYNVEESADFTVYVPKTDPHFFGSIAIIPLQLLAYYTSVAKGLDVDKPRNLAKSVTVE